MIVSLVGDNSYALRRRLDELTAKFVAEHGELALERIDGEETEGRAILDAVASLPFLAQRKMVTVRGLANNKIASEHIEQIISSIGETTDLIFYEPQVDKRTSYYKTLKAKTKFEEFSELDELGLTKWLVTEAEKQGGKLDTSDAKYMVERLGIDQLMLESELTKLITYESQITPENIELLTDPAPRSRVFDLLDAAFGGHKARALKLYEEQRAQKVEPQAILAMIAWQLQALAIVKAAGSRSSAEIARDTKLNPFVVRKTMAMAKKIDDKTLQTMVSDALEIDYRSKTTAIELDEALKTYIVTL